MTRDKEDAKTKEGTGELGKEVAATTPEEAGRRAAQGAKEGKAAVALAGAESDFQRPMDRIHVAQENMSRRLEKGREQDDLDWQTEKFQEALGTVARMEKLTRIAEAAYGKNEAYLGEEATSLLKRLENIQEEIQQRGELLKEYYKIGNPGLDSIERQQIWNRVKNEIKEEITRADNRMDELAKKTLGEDIVEKILEGKKTTKEK